MVVDLFLKPHSFDGGTEMKAKVLMVIGLVLLTLTVMATFGFDTSVQAQDKIVKVGVLAPLTGSVSADAQDYVNGAKLAAEEINKAGGAAGYKFDVVVADVGDMETDKVKSGFERLVNRDKVDVVMTGYASLTNFEIDLARQYEMPYLLSGNCDSTYAIITKNPANYPTVYSVTPPYLKYRTGFADLVDWLSTKGYFKPENKKVAVITSDNPYSKNISEYHKELYPKRGWTVTAYEMVPFGEVLEWGAVLAKIRNDKPSVIMIADYLLNNNVAFIDQFLKNPTNSLILSDYAPQIAEFQKILAAKTEGIIWQMLGDIIRSPKYPKAMEWLKTFEAKYNYLPGKYGSTLYDSVYIYGEALKKVGDPKKRLEIGGALLKTDYWGNGGHVVMDKDTHMPIEGEEYMPYFNYQWQGGNRVLIYPEKYATGTFKYPPWMKQ
jgi:branched-chain amino acid transport system substrate-binding protein